MRHLGIKNHRDGCSEGAHGPQPLGKDLTCMVTQARSRPSTRNTWLLDTEDTPRTLSLSCRDRRCPCKESISWHGKFPRSCDSSTDANSGPGQCHQQPTRGIPQARRVLSMMNKNGGFELKSGGLASDSGSLRAETAITVSHSSVAAQCRILRREPIDRPQSLEPHCKSAPRETRSPDFPNNPTLDWGPAEGQVRGS